MCICMCMYVCMHVCMYMSALFFSCYVPIESSTLLSATELSISIAPPFLDSKEAICAALSSYNIICMYVQYVCK